VPNSGADLKGRKKPIETEDPRPAPGNVFSGHKAAATVEWELIAKLWQENRA
jgi:hypothetical protein